MKLHLENKRLRLIRTRVPALEGVPVQQNKVYQYLE
jgi:hypothetical protein